MEEYFQWLCEKVCQDGTPEEISYSKLCKLLFETEFVVSVENDSNRASDGMDLRKLYFGEYHTPIEVQTKPCSMLEMMIGLASRMETIMDNPILGDRTRQWFWVMVASMGLNGMYNSQFDPKEAAVILKKFNQRKYQANGCGGLFTIKNTDKDLRKEEIWTQAMWFLDTLIS